MKLPSLRDNGFWYLIFGGSLIFFGLCSLPRVGQPVAQDELHWLVAAKTLHAEGVPRQYAFPEQTAVFSPHLYVRCVEAAFRFAGVSAASARLPGLVSGVMSIVLVFGITLTFAQGSRPERVQWASASSLLMASIPTTVQGAAIIDIDNTLLTPAIAFLCGAFVRYQREKKVGWAVLTGIAAMIALWCRSTTPMVVALLLVAQVFLQPGSRRDRAVAVGALAGGVCLFLFTWYLYCSATGMPFSGPFAYTAEALQNKIGEGKSAFRQIAQSSAFLVLWSGIFSCVLFSAAAIRGFRLHFRAREVQPEGIFLAGGVVILAGYTLVGGTIFGYPKYHSPGIPLLCIWVALCLSRAGIGRLDLPMKAAGGALVLVAFCVQFFGVGDLLYIARFTLRNSAAHLLPVLPVLKDFLARLAVLLAAFAAALFLWSKRPRYRARSLLLPLLFWAVGTNAGTVVRQSVADYQTGYNYGGRGTVETARFLKERVAPEGIVLAPSEIIFYLDSLNSPHLPNSLWTDGRKLQERLEDKKTAALVYGIATNTVQQVRMLSTHETLQELLKREFDQTFIGDYVVWIRKV